MNRGQTAQSLSEVKSVVVPGLLKPAAGDMQEGPSHSIADYPIADYTHVPSETPIHHCLNLYAVGKDEKDEMKTITRPFMHSVDLEGEKGITLHVEGLFDDSALVNSICSNMFTSLHDKLGPLVPSSKILKMADGTHVFLDGRWCGNVSLGEHTVKARFEVFRSRGGWSLLFGKPLLKQFKAVHDYGNDTLMIPSNGSWTTLLNECEGIPVRGVSQSNNDDVLRGDAEPPLEASLIVISNELGTG